MSRAAHWNSPPHCTRDACSPGASRTPPPRRCRLRLDSAFDQGVEIKVARDLKMTRFRPRFLDGQPVETPGVYQRQNFLWPAASDQHQAGGESERSTPRHG